MHDTLTNVYSERPLHVIASNLLEPVGHAAILWGLLFLDVCAAKFSDIIFADPAWKILILQFLVWVPGLPNPNTGSGELFSRQRNLSFSLFPVFSRPICFVVFLFVLLFILFPSDSDSFNNFPEDMLWSFLSKSAPFLIPSCFRTTLNMKLFVCCKKAKSVAVFSDSYSWI